MNFPIHPNRILTNMMLLAKLRSRRSSALDIRNDRFKMRQELLNLPPLRLHRLRQLCILRMRLLEFAIQRRLRFPEVRR